MDYKKEHQYLVSMRMAKKMLDDGIMTREEYEKVDTILTKKYGVFLSKLWSDIRLN